MSLMEVTAMCLTMPFSLRTLDLNQNYSDGRLACVLRVVPRA